jgi:hypothetical protein
MKSVWRDNPWQRYRAVASPAGFALPKTAITPIAIIMVIKLCGI